MNANSPRDQQPIDLDSQIFSALAYIRLHPFGEAKLAERLTATRTLSELAARLYGRATTHHALDQQQRSLITTASRSMDGTNGEALRRLLGLMPETRGMDRPYRHEMAGQMIRPKPLAGSSLARRAYWAPFLELAVAAIQATVNSDVRQTDDKQPFRNLDIPIVEREMTQLVMSALRHSSTGGVVTLYGPPGIGASTCAEQALERLTLQNRHVIESRDQRAYHRDMLAVLATYGIEAETWSLAACERALRELLERSPEALGGIVFRGVSTADEILPLLPLRHRAHVVITARQPSRTLSRRFAEWSVEGLTSEEARRLVISGHPTANSAAVDVLTRLLYRHPGLLAAAAQSRATVATLIRRLHRDRIGTALELAHESGIDLDGYARQIVRDLADFPDALLALDTILWLVGRHHRLQLYHVVGNMMPGYVSPARINSALAQLNDVGLGEDAWSNELEPPIEITLGALRQLCAHRMAPFLHRVAQLRIPDELVSAISISRATDSPTELEVRGSKVLLKTMIIHAQRQGTAALFCDPDGVPHAQLYLPVRYADFTFGTYPSRHDLLELYEDGESRPNSELLDAERDSNWPPLTKYMLDAFWGSKDGARMDHVPRDVAVAFVDRILMRDPSEEVGSIPLEEYDFGKSTVLDESVDYKAGEAFG